METRLRYKNGGNVLIARRRRGGKIEIQWIRRSWKNGHSHSPGSWGIPGGKRDKGESHLEVTYREFLEETGFDLDASGEVHRLDPEFGWFLLVVKRNFVPSPTASHARENHIKKGKVDTLWQELDEIVDLCELRAQAFKKKHKYQKCKTISGGMRFHKPARVGLLKHQEKIRTIMG